MKIVKEEGVLPKFLLSWYISSLLNSIELNGLLPMSRQYVHLSEYIVTAELVGKR